MYKEKEDAQSAHERFPAKPETQVSELTSEMITIDGRRYEIVKNYKDGLRKDVLAERYEQVLDKYDYVVGDWGFEKLRLKGFYDANRRQASPDQLITHVEDYLYEYCNFGCAYFIIHRLDAPAPTPETKPARRGGHGHGSNNQRNSHPAASTTDGSKGKSTHRGHRGGRQRHHEQTTTAKPYSERRSQQHRPERGHNEHASTSGKRQNRHFSIRKLDEDKK
ncbi:YutD family protein [Lacticaseibacillus zhaodongensis]|uniref:YutD family protein n=1 Tax=Lacticaseibacillus zhaodongensis TaxID=2668065 RepID=UPI0012D37246|nr:YutD family protein [Lacticaseibacillus zhaodongensis]